MIKASGYPVYAPSKIPAAGGKFRTLEGCPVRVVELTTLVSAHVVMANLQMQGHTHSITEIPDPKAIVAQYRNAVQLAKAAGFDGVELLAQG